MNISSESLLLLELTGSPAGAAKVVLLDEPPCGDSGHPPVVTDAAFVGSSADFARSRYSLSLASCLADLSIEKVSFAVAMMYHPLSSLARFFPFLGSL